MGGEGLHGRIGTGGAWGTGEERAEDGSSKMMGNRSGKGWRPREKVC